MTSNVKEQLLNHLYYNKLPQTYRDADKSLMTYPLKRYLSSLIEGGYVEAIVDIENLTNLVDPEKCPKEFLPMFCNSFGLEYFEDVGDTYQRRFLLNIGEIIKRRGTYSCVRFFVKVMTGLNVELRYFNGDYQGEQGRHLIITLLAETMEQVLNIGTSVFIVERYIQTQIPYYILPHVASKVAVQEVKVKVYKANFVQSTSFYNLKNV